ncbi:hypothetical protein BHE74_00046090 [Ensete ventricosum]|nr:hypothetical protein BHE74_00046090 [Ensete ventricosum]
MLTWSPRPRASDNWPADVADPNGEAGLTQAWGRQWSYGRPNTAADFPSRTPRFHPSDRAPTLHRGDCGRASAHRPEPAVLAQQTRRRNTSTRSLTWHSNRPNSALV